MKRDPRALEAALVRLEWQELKRTRSTVQSFTEPSGRVVTMEAAIGRPLIDFSSNDYLALSRHPGVAAAMAASAEHWGAGSGASHLVTGHGAEHARLEEELAEFTGRERALLFSTGYMANLAVVTSLAGRGEWVLLDARTELAEGGAGLATSVLSDRSGPVARGAQALLVAPR